MAYPVSAEKFLKNFKHFDSLMTIFKRVPNIFNEELAFQFPRRISLSVSMDLHPNILANF